MSIGNRTVCEERSKAALTRIDERLFSLDVEVGLLLTRETCIREILSRSAASHRDVNEPVEILVNRCLIARGEVVVVEGNYGVRIQQIASRQDSCPPMNADERG